MTSGSAVESSLNDEAIAAAFRTYLETYFVLRNLPAALELFTESTSGFGTGADEAMFDAQSVAAVVERDMRQAPNEVRYTVTRQRVQRLSEDAGLAVAEVDLRTTISEQELRFKGLRVSVVYRRVGDEWRIEHQHTSLPTEVHGPDESYPVKELEERNAVLARLVGKRTAELHAALEEIRGLAAIDALTGTLNRFTVDERLAAELARAERHGHGFALILLDIDQFKAVNDLLGHIEGDRLLRTLARLVTERVRKSDVVGRWGGEEFVIICPETSLGNAAQLAEDIRLSVASYDFGIGRSCTISQGVTVNEAGDTVDSIFARADRAMYAAKRAGRNSVSLTPNRSPRA